MKLKYSILISLATGAAVLAQGPPPGGPGPGRGFGPGGPQAHAFGARGKTVTGAPYSADVNFSRVETLPDGNTIQQTATGKFARDAQGRTYSMETFSAGPLGQTGPVTRISIFDPVAGYAYELDPVAKTATRRAIHQRTEGDSSKARAKWKGGPGGAEPDAADGARPAPHDAVKTDLSAQIVNGVNAHGTRTTRTIPAGAIGNAMPMTMTTETWYSPELQAVISSTHTDPRAGTTKYALTNIQKTVDASLFQVPAGYTVKDAARGGERGRFRGPGGPPPPPQE